MTEHEAEKLECDCREIAMLAGGFAPLAGSVSAEVVAEVERATRKFPSWPTDPLHALAVLGEEYGELTKEIVQLVYEPHKSSAEAVRREALQTAAMALRLLMSLDRYDYSRGPQHSQNSVLNKPPSA